MVRATDVESWESLKLGRVFEPVTDKDKIVKYLEAQIYDMATTGKVVDHVTGEETNLTDYGYTLGGIIWLMKDLYHFKKYNLPFKPDFLKIVREHY